MNILLHGAVSGSNFGDCLFADIFYNTLRQSFPDDNIWFFDRQPFGISQYLRSSLDYRYIMSDDDYNKVDALVYISGGYLGEDKKSLKESLVRYKRYVQLGKKYISKKIPILIIGLEVGPIYYGSLRKGIRDIIDRSVVLTVRNKESYDYCVENLNIRKAIKTQDTAICVASMDIPQTTGKLDRLFEDAKKTLFLHVPFGAKDDEKRDGKTSTFDARNWLRGNLDEICFFEQALPLTLINSYSSRSPRGDEAGLLTYITFDNRERQSDNTFMTVPYVYSKKMYKDSEGNIIYEKDSLTQTPTSIPQRDYLFADSIDVVLSHIDQSLGAPVLPNNEMHNLNFNFVGRDHSLLVNIKNANEKINKRNVYVTVREIPDLNGNTMLSPATACFLVNYSPLRWKENNMRHTSWAGYSSDIWLGIENNSDEKQKYKIEN